MKVVRLVCTALALTLVSGLTTSSSACDRDKATATTATKTKKVTAIAASSDMICTPEMMAACKAAMAAGSHDLCANKAAMATATVAVANDACCASKATKTSAAVATSKSSQTVYLAGADGSCGTKTKNISASASGQCSGYGMASMAAVSGHEDCEACTDMADCHGALDAAGAHRQTVRLKNGVMYVYTAGTTRNVNAVQAAVARRVDRMSRLVSAGDKAALCAECKAMRGAMASGKLNREVVNIEGGSLTLVTSSDPTVVAKIHALASDQKTAARIKS